MQLNDDREALREGDEKRGAERKDRSEWVDTKKKMRDTEFWGGLGGRVE